MKTILRAFLVIGLLAVMAVGAAGYMAYSFLNTPASDDGETTVFEVRPSESFKTIAQRLEDQNLIRSARMLELYGRFTKVSSKIRVGEYAIRKDARPKDVLAAITSGKSIEYSVTVQEGFNIFEISDVVAKRGIAKRDEFLALVRDPVVVKELLGFEASSLEGYLFPETYNITKFTGARGLIKMMVSRYKENFAKATATKNSGLNDRELVTLASIIEKETGAPEERPIISSVFYNRMKINMRLQTDPTTIYGIWEKTGQWDRNISKNDLMTPSRYNTYSFAGLPPGPIANPGLEAMKAAANPADSEALFFVSKGDGTHVFSKDLKGHVNAIAKFQLDKKAREGKSWRDLQKRGKETAPGANQDPEASKASPRVAPAVLPKAKAH